MNVERVSPNDLTELVTETPAGPQQMGAILRLGSPIPVAAVVGALGERVSRVGRLRQRLVVVPVGLGRPVWVDDGAFDIARHVRRHVSPRVPGESELRAVAASDVACPLPRDRPLWRATLFTDAEGGCHAVVLTLHHMLADGIGGLAALSELVDSDATTPLTAFPGPAPTRADLIRDVGAARIRALRELPAVARRLRAAVSELAGGARGGSGHRLAARTSLNRPIGRRRTLGVTRVPLAAVVDAAHRSGATVNDVLLAAVGGTFGGTLRARGEAVDDIVISVPVSGRPNAGADRLGNRVGVMPVRVPTVGPPRDRLAAVAAATSRDRQKWRSTRSGRGSSALILGVAFRGLARLHLFAWFIDRQRLVNTFLTNIRGPDTRLHLLGTPITGIEAISPIAGNVGIAFTALSYAGTLTITVIADPSLCPDIAATCTRLLRELDELTAAGNPGI
ncbi:MAG: hypothetical protein BGO26_15395 [Actinobacteria bacterium 69-20]|nr:MAG: hypothetical protein BGO26_15395 [Actinobacteria bacterium 69-20]